jgi:putative ABC transport system ATP-binding protein
MIPDRETSAMVNAENITKTYRLSRQRRVEALRQVSLCIQKGQSIIVSGPSGSGKSTLLNILGCLDRPSGGRIFHDGEDVTGFSEEELCRIRRSKIGFVFQDFHLLPRMPAWQNASVSLVPLGVSEKERYHRACEVLNRLGLHERILHKPEELSGGEQQRVAFARALMNDPELILADEPTSNIDADSAQKVLGILAELQRKNCTIVVATHDVDLFHQERIDSGGFRVDAIYRLSGGMLAGSAGVPPNAT